MSEGAPINSAASAVFVVGCQRSGTSAVWASLTAHPELEPINKYDPETGFDPKELYYFRNIFAARKQFPSPMYGWDVDREYLRRLVRMTADFCAEHHGSRTGRWVSAHPADGLHIPELCEALPEARIFCVLRHPQEVVWSALHAPWSKDDDPLARQKVVQNARHWKQHARMAMRVAAGELGDAVLLVRHEHIVDDPVAVADALARHVGLEPHERIRAQLSAPTFNSSNRDGRPAAEVVGEARARIARATAFCRIVASEAGDEMKALGYDSLATGDARDPEPTAPGTRGLWAKVRGRLTDPGAD